MLSVTRIGLFGQCCHRRRQKTSSTLFFSVDSVSNMSSSSDNVDVPLDAHLDRRVVRWQVHGSLLEDVFDTSVNHSLH